MDGKPTAGIPIVAVLCDADRPTGDPARSLNATTDDEGSYRLDNVPAGHYCIDAFAPTSSGLQKLGSLSKTLSIKDGESVEGIDLTLTKGGVITGKITDSEQRPLIDASVTIYRIAGSNGYGIYKRALTDDRGVYREYGLPPGDYTISVGQSKSTGGYVGLLADSYKTTYYGGVSDMKAAKKVNIETDQEAGDVDLQMGQPVKSYTVSGIILDADSNAPIQNANIVCIEYGPDGKPTMARSLSTLSNTKGEFFIENLSPGHYALRLGKQSELDYYDEPMFIDVPEGDLPGLVFQAFHSCSVSGAVVLDGYADADIQIEDFSIDSHR